MNTANIVVAHDFARSSPELEQLVVRLPAAVEMAGLGVLQGELDIVPPELLNSVLNPVRILRNALVMLLLRIEVVPAVKGFAGIFLSLFSCHTISPF